MAGCSRGSTTAPTERPASPDAAPALVVDASTHSEGSWANDIRAYRWADAKQRLQSLAPQQKSSPDARYALAVTCDELDDAKCSLDALDGLESHLPLLAERVFELRARAHSRLGASQAAAEAWLRKETPDNLARAALAFGAAADHRQAMPLADRAIASGRLSANLEGELRFMRLRERDDVAAWQDAHWIFVNAPSSKFGAEATRKLLASRRPPTQDDWILRTHSLMQAQNLDAALVSLDRATSVRDGKNSPLSLCRERARAFAATAGRHADAALQFERCSKLAGTKEGEDLFAEGRALAATEREEESALLFTHAVERSPRAPWAPEALYRAGRIRLLYGPWERTERDFATLGRNYPTATETREADLGRGLAFLAGKQWRKARATFERLGSDTYMPALALRATTLAGDAAWSDGDKEGALALWQRVAAEGGPSWPNLVARTRLRAHGGPLPPTRPNATASADTEPPLDAALPPPVDLLHSAGLEDEAEFALRPREGLVAAAFRGRETEALCGAYRTLGRGPRIFELGGRVPPTMLRDWPGHANGWAWHCSYPRPYASLVSEAAARHKVPTAWVYAILRQEGLLRARNKDGTRGLMGGDAPGDAPPRQIDAGIRKLAEMLRAHHSIASATTAYRAGSAAAKRWAERSRVLGADQEIEAISDPDARAYVMGVLADVATYTALAGSEWELGASAPP